MGLKPAPSLPPKPALSDAGPLARPILGGPGGFGTSGALRWAKRGGAEWGSGWCEGGSARVSVEADLLVKADHEFLEHSEKLEPS